MPKHIFRAAAALALLALPATAQDDSTLVINGEIEIITEADAPEYIGGLRTIYSGWRFRQPELQAMEMDDFDNPAFLFIEQAREDWAMADGTEGKSCADCHGDVASMRGVRPVYPKFNEEAGVVRTLTQEINNCRETRMGAEPLKYDGPEMTRIEALIGMQSRGMPMNVAVDGPAAETWAKGEEIYYTRYGQLELSCANCHEDNYGNHIRADHLSQGQTNGFPTIRIRTGGLVAAHNRFRGCIRDTRAHTFPVGSEEFVALELYVASRGNGLSVETPAVRQ